MPWRGMGGESVLSLGVTNLLGGIVFVFSICLLYMFTRVPSPLSLVVSSTPSIIKMSPDIVKCPQEAKIASGSESLFQEVGKINYSGNKVL